MGADQQSKAWHTSGEGQFEYIADLALSFTPALTSSVQARVIAQGAHSTPINQLFRVPAPTSGLAEKFTTLHSRREESRRSRVRAPSKNRRAGGLGGPIARAAST